MDFVRGLEQLPLFPLNTVLFPYASIQLHVFEERYQSMVRECIAADSPFGIVLIRSGFEVGEIADPYRVGTAVRIKEVHNYDDGRMDIYVQGERRFRIRHLDDREAHLIGLVEPVEEEPVSDPDRAAFLLEQAREEFEVLVQRLFERQEFGVQVVFPPDPVALSFTIANLLSMENINKQRLLETTDTIERFEALLPVLRTHIMDADQPSYYRIDSQELREWISPN